MKAAGTIRRFKRALFGAAILSVFAAVAVLLAWSLRPQWRTYTLPPDPGTGITIAIDYPEDWVIDPRISRPAPIDPWIQFVTREPDSLLSWCQKHLMGHRSESKLPTTIRFTYFPYVTTTADELEAVWASHRPAAGGIFDQVRVRRYSHRLGPELEIMQHIAHLTVRNGALEATSYQATIFLNERDPAHRMMITGSCFASADAPPLLEDRFHQVVARIHLVTSP